MNITIEQLSVIKFDILEVRIVTHLSEPWFIAADVCRALEIKNVTNAIKALDDSENTLCLIKGIKLTRISFKEKKLRRTELFI